ncbi:hypothetical protein [Helcococcus kunzii]
MIPSLKTANDIANALDVYIHQIFDLIVQVDIDAQNDKRNNRYNIN